MYRIMYLIITIFSLPILILMPKSRQDSTGTNKEIDLNKHLQLIDNFDEIKEDDGISCARDCTKFPKSRICYYKLVAEQYNVMGPSCGKCPYDKNDCYNSQCIIADGIERTVLVFNRMIPGPTLNVCYKDRIIVDVFNKMPGRVLTVHWHGILHEKSPWMDGVPFITQCPINEGQSYRYDFIASTKESHFYHSHEAFQMFDGLSGPLIIRTPDHLNPHFRSYDYDLFSHTIFIQDWIHLTSDNRFPGYHQQADLTKLKAENYLINGMGSFTNQKLQKSTSTPHAKFYVQHSKKYRFRIIAATSLTCSFKFTIQDHSMTLIAIDGNPVEAVKIGTMIVTSGDVFDIIVEANNQPSAYWIFIQGTDECKSAVQGAILQYKTSDINTPNSPYDDSFFTRLDLPDFNDIRYGCWNPEKMICMEHLNSLVELPPTLLKSEPDLRFELKAQAYKFEVEELYQSNSYCKFYLPVDIPDLRSKMFLDMFNNFSFLFPPFPILTESNPQMMEKLICPQKCPPKELCECLHIIKIPLNKVVEIILTDEISNDVVKFEHPQHIHGHHLIILRQKTKTERPQYLKKYVFDNIPPKPVVRSTVNVPAGGIAVMRFMATNPGYWLFHCHFTFHVHNGMAVLFQVGEKNEFITIPENLPKCGNN